MRGVFGLAAAALATFFTQSAADPTVARPGGVHDIVITPHNILNSTIVRTPGAGGDKAFKIDAAQSGAFPITIVNNFGNGMFMYLEGRDASNKPCLIGTNGQYLYPNADGTGVPKPITGSYAFALNNKGQSTTVTLPGVLQSARIWFAQGQLQFFTVRDGNGVSAIVEPSAANPSDPSAGVQWGFIEFNYDGVNIFGNISFVDFVGLPLGMGLTLASGPQQIVQGLQAGATANICNGVKAQHNADGVIWDRLCTVSSSGQALRVLSPNLYTSANAGAFSGYYDNYVNQVWSKYQSQDLTINTQTGAGNVNCRVSNNQLNCGSGDSGTYPKPVTADIWGCNSGPFANTGNDLHKAVLARLCAAFTRTTLLLAGGNVQPSLSASSYYTMNPTNHYSRIVHQYEVNQIGYAFAYDDVNPAGENAAGAVSGANPTNLKITVGGWS